MDKEVLEAIVVTALLVLSISLPIASAVSINYEADSDGDYIYINENYEIDNTVTVTETTDLYFGGLHVDQERTAEGTGKTDLEQTITGKPMEGAGYVAENDISNYGMIDAQTSTSATANTLSVDQEVFAIGYTDLHLEGEKADNKAGHDAGVISGTLRSKQTLEIENSVRTSLGTSIKGRFGRARSWAEDADENKASTFVWVDKGKINTRQKSEADGSATASKLLTASGRGIYMGCRASNAEGDHASMGASVGLGAINAFDAAKAIKEKATTTDDLAAIGLGIRKGTHASNAEGDHAGTYASVDAGMLASSENAEAIIDKAEASEVLAATGFGIGKGSRAWNKEGDYASTRASVDRGLVVSYDKAKAVIDKAAAYERLTAAGSGIDKGSYARNAEGDYAGTGASVDRGLVVSYDKAKAVIDKAKASERLTAAGSGIDKGSYAGNAEGDYAGTGASVDRGLVVSYDKAKAVIDKAKASERLVATGSGIWKGSQAWNAEGDYAGTEASVDRGLVVSYDKAKAIKKKAKASERLVATGSGIWKGSQAWNAEGDYAGTEASVDRGLVVSYDKAKAVIDKAAASERLKAAGSGIWKGSYAGNAEGDYAGTGASVDRGLVVSYDKAEAVIDKAKASERLKAAGSGIWKGSQAWNAEGDYAGTEASVDRGLVVSYDKAEAVIDKAKASELLKAAGSGIDKGSYAGNAEGDYAGTGASVDRGLVVSYDNAQAVIDKAKASERLKAAGSGIDKGSYAGNAEGDYAGTGASVDRGLVVSYDNAQAIKKKATASELLTAAGSGIWKGSQAGNAEGDYASTTASVDSGLVVSYDKAKAIKKKATASELLVANGSGIWKGSEAMNAEGEYASTGASVDNGLVVSYDNAQAIIDRTTVVAGSMITGDVIGTNSHVTNSRGDSSTYASVEDGTLLSFRAATSTEKMTGAMQIAHAKGEHIKASDISHFRNDYYVQNDVTVSNGDLTAGMGTIQMQLDDMKFEIVGAKVKLTEIYPAVAGMFMHTDSCDLVTASAEAKNANGYARNDVTVSNGDLTAGMGTIQMPIDMEIKIGRIKVKVTEMDNAVASMYMHTDSCDSVEASAKAKSSGTAYDAYTGSGTVTKSPLAFMLHLHFYLRINLPSPLPDIHIDKDIDKQRAEVKTP